MLAVVTAIIVVVILTLVGVNALHYRRYLLEPQTVPAAEREAMRDFAVGAIEEPELRARCAKLGTDARTLNLVIETAISERACLHDMISERLRAFICGEIDEHEFNRVCQTLGLPRCTPSDLVRMRLLHA